VLVLQGSVATKLSYGGKFFILVMSHFFLSDSDIERILKIDQHLPIYSKNKSGTVFLTHSVVYILHIRECVRQKR